MVAIAVDELDDGTVRALSGAKMDSRHDVLDAQMEWSLTVHGNLLARRSARTER